MSLGKKTISLRSKVTFAVAVATTACTAFMLSYFPSRFADSKIADAARQAESLAHTLANRVAAPLVGDDVAAVDEVVRLVQADEAVAYFAVIDDRGREIASFNKLVVSGEAVTPRAGVLPERTGYGTEAPVVLDGRTVGRIRLAVTLGGLDQDLAGLRAVIALSGLLLLVGALLASEFINRQVKKLPKRMSEIVAHITEGELTRRVEDVEDEAMHKLTDSFNRMIDMLQETQRRLEKANQTLEAKAQQLEYEVEVRKTMEDSLLGAMEMAESAVVTKDEFLANVTHELRTPMTGIVSATDLLLDTDVTGEQRGLLMIVKESSDAMVNLVDDLLDYAKIESGTMHLDEEAFSVSRVVESAVRSFKVIAGRKGLSLVCRVAPDVPERVVGDANRLRQALVNLVGNAVKFTPRGEVVVEVELERERVSKASMADHTCLHFAVRDTGIGIPEDKRRHIFERFTQVDGSHTREYGGVGLGLAITSQLIEMMGGRIWVDSVEKVGSTFHFIAYFGKHEGGGVGKTIERDVPLES